MTKTQLIADIASAMDVSKRKASDFVNTFIDTVIKGVKKDWEVRIQWFWTFKVSHRSARNWVNPRTQEKIKIPAMKLPSFKVWAEFKKAIK